MRKLLFSAIATLAATVACSGREITPPAAAKCTPAVIPAGGLVVPVGSVSVLCASGVDNAIPIAASTSPADYLFVAASANTVGDVSQHYVFTSTLGTAVAASLQAAPSPSLATLFAPSGDDVGTDVRMLRNAQSLDLSLASPAVRSPMSSGIRANISAAAVPVVGATQEIRVPRQVNSCASYDSITAVVKAVGTHVIIEQDEAAPANGFTTADFNAIANEFDSLIYAADTSYFGSPSDLDANQRIMILYTPLVNKLTPRGETRVQGGFFWSGDLFPRSSCKQSNLAEIFYLLVADPTGVYSSVRTTADTRQRTRGTVAHEFQHMINAGVRLRNKAAAFESPWLDEGLAHFAEEAVGRTERGFGPYQSLSFADVYDVSNSLRDYNAFFYQNAARFRGWLAQPQAYSPTSSAQAETSTETRGAAWSLIRYAVDQFSSGNATLFTRNLAKGPDTSVANLVKRAGVPFDTLLSGWMIANYADDTAIAGLSARYSYVSWNMRDYITGAISSTASYPLLIHNLPSTSSNSYPDSLRSGTGSYFRLTTTGPMPETTIQIRQASGAVGGFNRARVYVLRVK